tara:strand:- start:175 stop:585 length:411 start_codon:yes stop_codon:yes gene_type:complete
MSADREAVLFSNEAFYSAFRGRDMGAMEELWAEVAPVAVIHPGWQALTGRQQVIESWQAILEGPNSPEITCHGASAHVCGDVAYVLCYERVGDEFLVATNIFAREGSAWRMVHHQAGPTSITELPDESDSASDAVH